MGIKERVLATMKTSYAKYGFKKEELSSLTDIVSANLTDESTDEQVSEAVTNAEGYARMMQTIYNRGVSETNKKYEGYIPRPEPPKPEPLKPDPKPDPAPTALTAEEIKKMINAGIEAGLKPYREREEQSRLGNMLQSHDKVKNIPKLFREKYHLDKEENLDTLAAQIESDYATFKQELVSSGQFVKAPSKGTSGSDTDDFLEVMKGYGERNKPEPSK